MRISLVGPISFICLLAICGFAQPNPENWCRGGFFTSDFEKFSFAAARGSKSKRIYFYNDDRDDCPGNERCRGSAYIIPGNEVVVSKERGGFGCAWFTSQKGAATVGWVKLGELDFKYTVSDGSPRMWVGEWQYGENSIKISSDGDEKMLRIAGNAFWRGLGDNIHIGELDGPAKLIGGVLHYSDGEDEFDCRATLRLAGTYLIVADNLRCGGANVSFSGVYTRRKK